MAKFESKNVILTKKLNNVIYEIMVKTNSDMVYVDSRNTLTEKLSDICDLLTEYNGRTKALQKAFNSIISDSPEVFSSFKEVWDYVNINGDPKSALIQMIEQKQNAEKGKGLSTHDFDDILYQKLINGYSKEELDEKFSIILESERVIISRIEKLEKRPNIQVSNKENNEITDYSCWYQIISADA